MSTASKVAIASAAGVLAATAAGLATTKTGRRVTRNVKKRVTPVVRERLSMVVDLVETGLSDAGVLNRIPAGVRRQVVDYLCSHVAGSTPPEQTAKKATGSTRRRSTAHRARTPR